MKKNTYGVRTLERRHIEFMGDGSMRIRFVGKKGVENSSIVKDRRIVEKMREICRGCNGKEDRVFRKIGGGGIGYDEWRDFLKGHKIEESKTIRTYYANELYMKEWRKMYKKGDEINRKNIKTIIDKIAGELHHTGSILKKSYLSKELYMFSQSENGKEWIKGMIGKNEEKMLKDFFGSFCKWSKRSIKD
jgi:DNA topoisomerase IB